MRRIDVRDGIRLAVEVHGEGEPLVLIMGIGAQLVFWPADLIQGLVRQGFQVITFDNRDCGLSTRFDDAPMPAIPATALRAKMGLAPKTAYTLHDMADDVAGLMDHLGLERSHIVGTSMGGMIAQLMAIFYPERLYSLTSIMSSSGNRHLPTATPAATGTSPNTP